MPATKEIIRKIISEADILDSNRELLDDTDLAEQGIDSIGIFTIILAVQDHYKIEIPDEAIGKLRTVNALVDYIDKQ